jgi:hypothetical protein
MSAKNANRNQTKLKLFDTEQLTQELTEFIQQACIGSGVSVQVLIGGEESLAMEPVDEVPVVKRVGRPDVFHIGASYWTFACTIEYRGRRGLECMSKHLSGTHYYIR